jgi:putative tryptophan/tyrosine transport system substrate-binding protein
MIARRDFVCAVAGTLLGAPLGVAAQQAPRVYRIGFLAFGSETAAAPYLKAFEEGLREFGYVKGRNIAIEYRFAEGKTERLPGLAAELVGFPVDVIMPGPALAYFPGSPAVAASRLTKTIPIVMFHADPVGSGLVASLARPGGNITGLTNDTGPELQGKLLGLLRDCVPKVRRVAYLGRRVEWEGPGGVSARATARAWGLGLFLAEPSPNDYTRAFESIVRERPDAMMISRDVTHYRHRRLIAEFAARNRLPSMGSYREFAEAGGLLSYGHDIKDIYRRVAIYVDKILKGAKPADLPIEQPTKFELVINARTAKALGLTIPPSLLARADQVIE